MFHDTLQIGEVRILGQSQGVGHCLHPATAMLKDVPVLGPRILFVGHGRSGKDEAAGILHGLGKLKYAGSLSWFALPYVANYLSLPQQVCWETRHARRETWKSYCDWFRKDDQLRLVNLALAHGNVITGVRARAEIDAVKSSGLFDAIVWVERPGNPVDPTVDFTEADCTDTILNNETLQAFHFRVVDWAERRGFIE